MEKKQSLIVGFILIFYFSSVFPVMANYILPVDIGFLMPFPSEQFNLAIKTKLG